MSELKEQKTPVLEDQTPRMSYSRSLYNLAAKSPAAAISSIAALFIVIILSITIPVMFSPCKSSQT